MLELKLMNSLGEFTKKVEVNENALIIINVVSGDWVMVEPFKVDADKEHRNLSMYDGTVKFLATQENINKINAMTDPLDIIDEFSVEEINEGWN